jgi:hypothetical protein
MNDVGDEINGKVEVSDGDGVLFDAFLANAVDGFDHNTSSALSMCAEDIDKVERRVLGLSEEETI